MPMFDVSLVRSFKVAIEAANREEAARLVELYVGYTDLSDVLERKKFQFEIQEIEMTQNDAIEVSLRDDAIAK